MRAFAFALGAFVLGVIGGAVYDERPPRPAVYRGGYRVVEADFHVHTTYSDGTLSPLLVVRQAERRGLDVIAVTEHNTAMPSRIARTWARWTDGPLVVSGEEVTSWRYHVIALGNEETILPEPSVVATVEAIHRSGGLAIAAHPVQRFQPGLAAARGEFDGAEVMHPIAYSARDPSWRWADMLAWWETLDPPRAAIGSSDYHFASIMGLCRTLVFVREPLSSDSVLDALRARRTVVFDRAHVAHGDPAMTALLEREPYEPRSSDYAYRGVGLGDRALRLLGLLGVAGIAFLSPRRRKAALPKGA